MSFKFTKRTKPLLLDLFSLCSFRQPGHQSREKVDGDVTMAKARSRGEESKRSENTAVLESRISLEERIKTCSRQGKKGEKKVKKFLILHFRVVKFCSHLLAKSVSAICKTIGMRACWYKQSPHWRSRRFCWGFGCSDKYLVDLHRYALRYSEQAKSTQNPGACSLFTAVYPHGRHLDLSVTTRVCKSMW